MVAVKFYALLSQISKDSSSPPSLGYHSCSDAQTLPLCAVRAFAKCGLSFARNGYCAVWSGPNSEGGVRGVHAEALQRHPESRPIVCTQVLVQTTTVTTAPAGPAPPSAPGAPAAVYSGPNNQLRADRDICICSFTCDRLYSLELQQRKISIPMYL